MEVPSKPLDPFNTRVANKDQSRVQSPPFPPKVDPTFALIAAAEMHNQGRLVEPDGTK